MDAKDPAHSPICTPVSNLKQSLGLQQDPNNEHWVAFDACLLLVWLIFYRLLVYIALRIKTRGR